MRRYLVPLFATLLAGVSIWWLSSQEEAPPSPSARPDSPDFFMEGVTTRVMDAQGRPRYDLRAERVEHFTLGDRTEFDRPSIVLMRPDGRLWILEAERGSALKGDEEVRFLGRVLIRRPLQAARPDSPAEVEIHTRDLRVLPGQEYAETEQQVQIIHPSGRTEARGMRVWFAEERVQLLSQVRGIYEP